MVDWRTIKKIDAHIHILPDDVHETNPDSEDAWVHDADLHKYRRMMDELGVEKAVIMPFNDPWLMSMEFTIDAVHKNLYDMKQRYPGRFYAFADIDIRNTPAESVELVRKATQEYGLDGSKSIQTIPALIWIAYITKRSLLMLRRTISRLQSIPIPI